MRTALMVCLWIPAVLWCDRTAGPAGQFLLGAVTWALLIALLARATAMRRTQTLIVVAFATAIEYIFSAGFGVYVYRLDHVPAYVPPGHGLVYLAALGIGGSIASAATPEESARRVRWAVRITIVVAGLAAAYGLWRAPRPDALGAFWYLCLVGFLIWGRNRPLYVGAFIVVTWLEVLGTAWGVWRWMPRDTLLGIVTIGNPPSVAAGGYGWFDLAAVALAPVLVGWWRRLGVQQGKGLVVEEPIGADGAAVTVGVAPVEAGHSATSLNDDGHQSGDVPGVELRLSGHVDRPFGHEHVRPEVAVGAATPATIQ